MAPNLRPQPSEQVPEVPDLQDGNPRISKAVNVNREWVSSLDVSNTYFHIPINHTSQEYLRFHCQNQTFRFTDLPFGLFTAHMKFTIVVKEIKFIAQICQILIHQYFGDWLIQAKNEETRHQHTQSLLALCQN